MSSFSIDYKKFSKDTPPKLTTKIIGHYSIDSNLKYHDDLSQMKYYIPPQDLDNVSFDLNEYFKYLQVATFKPPSYIGLVDVLRWVSENFKLLEKPSSHQESQWLDTDFICRRGALETLLCTPFNISKSWTICASKYRGTIYLCEFYTAITESQQKKNPNLTEDKKQKILTEKDKEILQTFKFKHLMVADHPSNKPNTTVPLKGCEKFHCMIKANFDSHSLLYQAEIDAISSQQPIMDTLTDKTFELIRLNTLKLSHEIGTVLNDKCGTIPVNIGITWWSQNYLAGVEKLICGIKNNHEQVEMIKEFSTHNLSQLSKPCGNVDKCKMFCKIFLDNVKKIVIKDYNECIYKFHFDASKNVINVINYSEEAPNEKYLLTRWFVKKAENYDSTSQ